MSRIPPLEEHEFSPSMRIAFERHMQEYKGRITNMKATLGHSLLSFDVYMQWYPLYVSVEKIVGKRMAYLYAYSISYASECPLCSTFFRKIIIDSGERPENLSVSIEQQELLDLGSCIAKYHGNIADRIYNRVAARYSREELVVLIAFAGQMIATNVFNNVIETEIDEYLIEYLPSIKYH
jgi:hypothetical protein